MERLSAVTAALALGLTVAACGGDQGSQQQSQTTTKQSASAGPQIEVSDADLEAFVRASVQLDDFRTEMQQRMSEAANQEEGQKVRKRLMQERDSIIQAAGLEGTERYNAIMKAIKSSDRIQKRYSALLKKVEAQQDTAADDTTS